MVSVTQNQVGFQGLIQRAVNARKISRQEHLQLTSAMLSTSNMPASDRAQINRLLDAIRAGKVRLID
ncbi:MAG: hypothetical protein AAGE59_10170 [Cyanobacteria bacterium P01_F01_bin.86]